QAQRSGDLKKLLAAIDEIVEFKPELEPRLAPTKFTAMMELDEQDKDLDYAKELEKRPMGKNPDGLNALAWMIVDPDSGIKPNAKLIQFALEVPRRADDKSDRKNGAIADTLAKAYFDSGEVEKAIETQ